MRKYLVVIMVICSVVYSCKGKESNTSSTVNITNVQSKNTSEDMEMADVIFKDPYWVYALFFILGSGLTLVFPKMLRGNGRRDKNNNRNTEILYQDHNIEVNNQISSLKIRNTNLIKDNKKLEQSIDTLNKKLAEIQVGVSQNEKPIQNAEPIVESSAQCVEWVGDQLNGNNVARSELKILYFPNPTSDSTFRKIDGNENYIESASIYKFTLESDSQAYFEFCETQSSVGIALNNRYDLILAVATEKNAYNPSATKIVCEDGGKGVAILEGNVWRVENKAKIKYI